HALWIDPTSSSRMALGNDGGFFWSTNAGGGWNKSLDLPITQFYAGAVDPANPSRLLGGSQDNQTMQTSGSPSAWSFLGIGGDGFYLVVEPPHPNVVLRGR